MAEKEAETQKKIALSEAEKNALVSKILMQQMLTEKDSSKRQQQIDNEMFLARERALADANYYRHDKHYCFFIYPACACLLTCCIWSGLSRITKEAEANKLKLTPEYLELRFIESIANNTKIFFGEKVLQSLHTSSSFVYLVSPGLSDRLFFCRFRTSSWIKG
mgnify:CR=1 FL=1